MLHLKASLAAVVGLLAGGAFSAACTANLLVDDFSAFSSNQNSLKSWTSDDGSMTSIAAANKVLKFKPGTSGYFYETLNCVESKKSKYDKISFGVKGPSGGSFMLEIQHQTSCSATKYSSYWHYVGGATGSSQTITIPLADLKGVNLDAITTIGWSGFSSPTSEWQLSNVRFLCSTGGSTPSTTPKPTTSTKPTTTAKPTTTPKPTTTVKPSSTTSKPPTPSTTSATCPLLVEDWRSQSRLTFLGYNALLQSTNDDLTMKSIEVQSGNRVVLTPKSKSSYFYSKFGCLDAKPNYNGLVLTVKAPAGTTLDVQLGSAADCWQDDKTQVKSASSLGWKFDGTEQKVTIPFSQFPNVNKAQLATVMFKGLSGPVTLGPVAVYCNADTTSYKPPVDNPVPGPSSTVPAPAGTAAPFVVDNLSNKNQNTLGLWHGADDGMGLAWGSNGLTITSTDADYSFYTKMSNGCRDMTSHKGSYVHITYSGSTKFSIALQQHNSACNEQIAPFPETWDSLEATRYAKNGHIYIPVSHFKINLERVIGFAFKGFYSAEPVTIRKVEIVKSVPSGYTIPNKLPSGNLVFACKRPNSFAFAIDDGIPSYAKEVMDIIRSENIKVTFFTVGLPLADKSTGLADIYNQMIKEGHQVALHTYTHPKMEGLPDIASIDWEYQQSIKATEQSLNGLTTPYFRPPFGTEGARMRQRLAQNLGTEPYIVNWSVDVEDWLWATSPTPEKQLEAFQRDVNKGGNLVVLHYLHRSTVDYLREFIKIAKSTGKKLMRVDQCMEDPNAPAL